jgi:hypothetical protein
MDPYSAAKCIPRSQTPIILPFASNLIRNVPHPAKRIPPNFRDRLKRDISCIHTALNVCTYRLQKDTGEHDSDKYLLNSVLEYSPLALIQFSVYRPELRYTTVLSGPRARVRLRCVWRRVRIQRGVEFLLCVMEVIVGEDSLEVVGNGVGGRSHRHFCKSYVQNVANGFIGCLKS